jgi:hypothetical protein
MAQRWHSRVPALDRADDRRIGSSTSCSRLTHDAAALTGKYRPSEPLHKLAGRALLLKVSCQRDSV